MRTITRLFCISWCFVCLGACANNDAETKDVRYSYLRECFEDNPGLYPSKRAKEIEYTQLVSTIRKRLEMYESSKTKSSEIIAWARSNKEGLDFVGFPSELRKGIDPILHQAIVRAYVRGVNCMRDLSKGHEYEGKFYAALSGPEKASYYVLSRHGGYPLDRGFAEMQKKIDREEMEYRDKLYSEEEKRIGAVVDYYCTPDERFDHLFNSAPVPSSIDVRQFAKELKDAINNQEITWVEAGLRDESELQQLVEDIVTTEHYIVLASRVCDVSLSRRTTGYYKPTVSDYKSEIEEIRKGIASKKTTWRRIGFRDESEFESFLTKGRQ